MLMKFELIPAAYWLIRIPFGNSRYQFSREIDFNLAAFPAHSFNPLRPYQNSLSGPPISCIDNDVANLPSPIIKKKIFHVADLATNSRDVITSHLSRTA